MNGLLDNSPEVWQSREHLCNQGTLERKNRNLEPNHYWTVGGLHYIIEVDKNSFLVITQSFQVPKCTG
jgi:hypothetical protein